MATLGIGEYRPDVNDLDSAAATRYILNVLARGDGYGPVKDVAAFTAALGATCRGYFYSRDTDGTINIFAATQLRLYQLDNTLLTWTDVSAGSPSDYAALADDAMWQFAQFGDFVIAVNSAVNPQVFDISSDTQFSDLGDDPPKAAYIAIVGRFVVLSGLAANPYRTQWSGLGDAENWTAGTFSSDYQDAPDGGIVRQVLGGEQGFILQDQVVRRMTFSPGSDVIFVIEKIGKDIGLLHPYAACTAGDKIFFLSPKGFIQTDSNGGLMPIGAEKVDRTFFAAYDSSAPQLVQMAADPNTNLVICVYRRSGSTDALFTDALAYNYLLQRWTPFMISGEYITSLATPGLTLEALGAIAPGVQSIVALTNNGSGLIRVQVASTAAMTTGDYKTISGVLLGSFADDANGDWAITVIDGTKFDLVGSATDSQNVTGTAAGTAGRVRLAVASTAAWVTGSKVVVASIVGTTEANGNWVVNVIDATHVDLVGSTFANAWISGGTLRDRYDVATDGGIVEGSADAMDTPWDAFGTGTLPALSVCNSDHKVGFQTGDNLEATLHTSEQSGDGQRLLVDGFWPLTDSATVYGRIGKRDNLNASFTYTDESTMNTEGFVPQLWSTRYVKGVVRIPAAAAWTYCTGIRPQSAPDGEH